MNTDSLIAAYEGNTSNAVSMLSCKHISGGEIVTLIELATLDEEDQSLMFWHCGPIAPPLANELMQ